jgi:hypothetical protein
MTAIPLPMTHNADARNTPIERFPEVQKVLGHWTGKEMPALQAAAIAVGQLVGTGVLTFRTASETINQSAEARGYLGRFDSDDVAACIESSLLSGQYCHAPANDNKRNNSIASLFTSDVSLSELTNPGGVVSDITDWIVSSSSRPSRELALAATLPFVGSLIGRRFSSPTDLRTNFYCVGLAGSGYGKDHARTQLKRLITAAGLDRFTGPSRFMSATALRNSVMVKPSCFCMVDEFGGMMRQINDPRAGIHNQLIRSDLLELFSSADTFFEGAAYAGSAAEKLYNPNLCLYGTSTPEDFWGSVSSLNTTDGLLPRFLLFNVTGPKPARVVASKIVYDVPETLVKSCQALALAGRGMGNLSNTDNGGLACKPTIVSYSADAATELARFETFVEEREITTTPGSAPILNRAVEHAIKLALTVSVATNWEQPIITGHAVKWAVQLAWLSTCTMIEETCDRISDNAREADLKRILGHIKKAGQDGITEGTIADRCGGIDKKRRTELFDDLVLAGRIEERSTPTAGRPRKRYYPL